MSATATKRRGAARSTGRRQPSPQAITKIEKTIEQLPDLTAQQPTLPAGLMYDSEYATHNVVACVKSGPPGGDNYDVTVAIEISADGCDSAPPNAYLQVTCQRYLMHEGETERTPSQEKGHLELYAQELEPLALALARALQLAKARGFLPSASGGTTT